MAEKRSINVTPLVECVRAHIWARRNDELTAIGLKSASRGEWQVPTPEQLSILLPAAIVEHAGAQFSYEKPRKALFGRHTLQVHFLRLLGDAERKNTLVQDQAQLIADLFAQDNFQLPGWTPQDSQTTGCVPATCYPSGFETHEGFLIEENAEIEHVTITLMLDADNYNITV